MIQETLPFPTPEEQKRLAKQLTAIRDIVADGGWHTLGSLRAKTGFSDASISARLRELKNRHGWTLEKHLEKPGLWLYRMGRP